MTERQRRGWGSPDLTIMMGLLVGCTAPSPASHAGSLHVGAMAAAASPLDDAQRAMPETLILTTPSKLEETPPAAPPPVPTPIVRRPGAYANLDPTDDFVVGPPEALPDCVGDLTRAGVSFGKAKLPVHTEGKRSKIVCGAPEVVWYLHGPSKITYNPTPLLTCSMALALASFERLLQEEAERIFHSPVVRIDQIGTYVCREVAAFPGTVSEHSYANAIDIGRFVLKNGKSIEVLRDFDTNVASGDQGDPKKPSGALLRVVTRRANDEDVFSHVLTPFFNATHRNHFHLDLARYRSDGTRP